MASSNWKVKIQNFAHANIFPNPIAQDLSCIYFTTLKSKQTLNLPQHKTNIGWK